MSQGDSLSGLAAVVAALDARDLGTALGWLADDVRVQVDGLGPAATGTAAVAALLQDLLDRTSDSRFQVHVSSQGQGRARQEVTVAARRLPPADQDWVLARGTATWEVAAATGLVRRVHVAVDREAFAAQWHRTAPLRPGSFRTQLALASFDPDEPVLTTVTVQQDPAPRRRRRAGALLAAAAVATVLAGGAVAGGLLLRDEGAPQAAPTTGAGDPAPAVEPAPSAAPSPAPSAVASVAPVVQPTQPVDPPTPAAVPSQAPALRSEEGAEVVEEDDGTQVLSLSEAVLFDTGSATLSPVAGAVLGGVADRLSGAAGQLVVVGHTDNVGTVATNDELAADRARAVADVISRRLGEGPVSIVIEARGAREPVASNDTEDGRAANRRVELRFTPDP